MNKIVTSIGLIAISASALHAVESSGLSSMQKNKAWSVSATLRGFYDDNVDTQPNGVETTGIRVSPSIKFGMPGEQTSFNVGYAFAANFYDKAVNNRSDRADYTHTFDADLFHAFSPRADVSLNEAFVIGQEPDTLRDPAGTQRISGDNIRNFAGINFNLAVTHLLGFSLGYNNSFYDYADELNYPVGTVVGSPGNPASNSGLLDRMQHDIHIDSNWTLSPQTVGLIGYTYSQTDFTGDETIAGAVGSPGAVKSDFRNSVGHIVYVGGQHVFSPTLSGSVRVGGQYTTYDNNPTTDSQLSPYALASLNYALQATTSFECGFSYSLSAANAVGAANYFVRDTDLAVIYGALKHEIISKLVGSIKATVENGKYNGGGPGVDGNGFYYYQLGLNLAYEINRNFSASIGYNFDKFDSDLLGRSYDRNRVYLGVTAGF